MEKEENPVCCASKALVLTFYEIIDLFEILMKATDILFREKIPYLHTWNILHTTLRNSRTPLKFI